MVVDLLLLLFFGGIILFVSVFVLLFYGFFSVVGVLFSFVCVSVFSGFFVFGGFLLDLFYRGFWLCLFVCLFVFKKKRKAPISIFQEDFSCPTTEKTILSKMCILYCLIK